MKAFSKRVLSLGLSLAMVASVIAVPSTEAQAATGIAKSKTYYAGQTKTLNLTTSSKWKNVKTTWSTSKKSIVKIAKKTNKTVTINCVKAGKANVTAKVSFKKGTKKYTKKYTCKVTVKNPTFEVSAGKTTLKLGETTAIKVTKKPASAVVKYSSDDAAIAKISGGKITATGIGTTNINARMKIGNQTVARKSVEITVIPSEDGISATLVNPATVDYDDVVFVNQSAIINVGCVLDGKPVSGETLVMDLEMEPSGSQNYRVVNTTAVTNAKGIATFVVENINRSTIKASTSSEVASARCKITDPATNATTEKTVNFVSVGLSEIFNLNNTDVTIANLVPGTNYKNSYGYAGVAYTASMEAPTVFTDEYVASQQVSLAGKDDHKVYMKGGYPVITLPNTESGLSSALKGSQKVDLTYGDYKTYTTHSEYVVLNEDPSKLTYATLNFEYMKLSAYTKATIQTYKNKSDAEKSVNPVGPAQVYKGEQNQGAFGYQIPLNSNYAGLCVKITIESAGQVDANMNAGYKATDIEYVYKKNTTTNGYTAPLKNAKVDWKIAKTDYTAELDLATVLNTTYPITIDGETFNVADGGRVTVKLPVFPKTGTAIITDYDANGKVEAYYACTTRNNNRNQNIITLGEECYKITSDELRDEVGSIVSQDGSVVVVNSEKSGRTTLVGDVTVNGEKLETLDAETNTVYTSIQWNPIPNGTEETVTDAFVALLGQNIEVTAQLVDKNDNAVTLDGKKVFFKYGASETTINADMDTFAGSHNPQATIVDIDKTTDSKGQATLILKASDITVVTNVIAECEDKNYNVKLVIADKKTDNADLYWIDADLQFDSSALDDNVTTATDSLNNIKRTLPGKIAPKTGGTWYYGVKTVGTLVAVSTNNIYGKLQGAQIDITGLTIQMSKNADGVGTIDTNTGVNGMVKASSVKAGDTDIISKIDGNSLADKIEVVAKRGTVEIPTTFAGKGKTSINKKLTLAVQWQTNGTQAEMLAPNGPKAAVSANVYVKVTDTNGNPVRNKTVTFKVDDSAARLIETDGTANDGIVKTNTDGIAVVELQKGNNTRATVSATVDGISDQAYSKTITFVTPGTVSIDPSNNNEDNVYKSVYNGTDKTIKLTFTEDIVESSVIAEMFTVRYGKTNADAIKLSVDSVSVEGNVLTLKLANVPSQIDANAFFDIAIGTTTVKSVSYTMTSESGAQFNNVVSIKATGAKESMPQIGARIN